MGWLMDVCLSRLGWEAWLILCVAVVVLWVVAIAGAAAVFDASARPRRSDRRNALEEPTHGHAEAD